VLHPGEPAITEMTSPTGVFDGSIVGMETYPPAPWWSAGAMWIAPLSVGGRRIVLAVVRYREGTLSYNEVFFGSVVRRGLRVGLSVHGIWVDSVASLWGGREIWGLPKQLATFTWRNRGLTMTAEDGRLDVRFSGSPRWSARVPFIAPAFGSAGQFFHGIGHGRLRLARIEVVADLPSLRVHTDAPTLWLNDFRLVVRAPRSFVESEPEVFPSE